MQDVGFSKFLQDYFLSYLGRSSPDCRVLRVNLARVFAYLPALLLLWKLYGQIRRVAIETETPDNQL
jgi:hypothetical protein